MTGENFKKPVKMMFAIIGTYLDLSDTKLSYMDLTGAQIHRGFRLSRKDKHAKWRNNSKLILHNSRVGVLQGSLKAWPDKLNLDGFTYARLSGFTTDGTNDLAASDIPQLQTWLERDVYSPQPYEQLAKVLRETGHKDMAQEILYLRRERERSEVCLRTNSGIPDFSRNSRSCNILHHDYPFWLWLSALRIFIGYGYRIYYAIFWAAGLTISGMVMLQRSGQGPLHGMRYYGFAYSVDMLLPIIQLRQYHYDSIDLKGWVRGYFYVHKVFGYVLVLFLVAGLTGLTK